MSRRHWKYTTENALPSSVSRGGVLLVLRRVRDPDRRCLRRIRTGEWLGSLFHLSRLSNDRLRNTGRLPLPLDLDLRLRSEDRDLERLLLSPDRDRFFRPVERLRDRLFLSVDLDLFLPRLLAERERDRLLRVGERDLDRRALVRDLERDLLRRVAERETLDLRRRAGLRDFDRRFFLSDGETESLFLTGDFDLGAGDRYRRINSYFSKGEVLHRFTMYITNRRRGEDVARGGFLRSEGESDSSFFSITGDAERERLFSRVGSVLT